MELRNSALAAIDDKFGRWTVFIFDNAPRISIEATDPFTWETSDTDTFLISRTGTTVGALFVPLAISDTAISAEDFTSLPSSVTIPDGARFTTLNLNPLV